MLVLPALRSLLPALRVPATPSPRTRGRVFLATLFALLCAPLTMFCQQATPAAKILTFNPAEVNIAASSVQTLTASFTVSGYSGSFTPTAVLHYAADFLISPVTCTGGASETCTVSVGFQPILPGARKDAIFLMNGTTRLATVLLGGVGQGPMPLVQPGAFSTSVPSSGLNTSGYNYIYKSVADEDGTVYILPSGNAKFLYSVTRFGVVTQIPLTNPPYFWTIDIDGAGVLYLFNESNTATTYDTVQGIQGTYSIPAEPLGPDAFNEWYPGVIGVDGSVYVIDQIRNNGDAYALKPDGTTAYGVTLDPGVLQPYSATVDSVGNFFVGGYEINKITPAGVQTQVNTVGALEGLAVDAADTLYATRYSPTGGVAELPASNYSIPIASIDTSSSPLGVSLGSHGTVYVSNYVNLDIFDRSQSETVDFGEVDAGKASTVSTASVYNGGNQPLTILRFKLSGDGFGLDPNASNECASGTVLAPGTLCQASVVFSPTHPGVYSGAIQVDSSSPFGTTTQDILLTGTTYGSYDVVSPSPLVFPSQTPATSTTLPVTLTNKGSSYASTIYSVATDNTAFTIAQGTCAGVAVQPGASCQLQVTFSPTAVQAYSGNATIVTYVSGTAQAAQTITLPLSGSGVGPVAATPVIAPGTGSYTSSQQVIITDTTPGATMYYTIDGSAPSTGSTKYNGAITVNANETLNVIATATGYSQSAVASATYTFHEAIATVTPTSLAFGNQVQGIAGAAQTVTLKNIGTGMLTLTGFPITGSADFSQTNNCGGSLTAGSSCTLSIVYTPSSLGATTATLTVNSDSIKSAPAVTLTGTGIVQPPVLTLSSLAIAFGNQIVNTSSAAQSVTVTNTSTTDTVTISNPQINALGFLIQPSSCTSPLAPGASCAIPFVFSPAAIHAYTATVTFKAQAYGCGGCVRNYPVESVTLTGTGIAQPPVLTISPPMLAFGNQIVNTSSAAQSVTITNISKTDTIVVGSIFTTSSGAFIAQSLDCSSPLAPGKNCTVSVIFSPLAIQAYSGTVTFQPQVSGCGGCTRNYPAQTLAVTGVGIAQPPVLAISPAILDFGKQLANTTSAPLPVTITNTSATDAIALTAFNIYGPGFTFNFSTCPTPFKPGASCIAYYVFTPTTFQDYNVVASIQPVPYQCGGCGRNYPVQTFHLIGLGVPLPPALTFSPSSLNFGDQPVNTRSAEQFITVTNASTTDTVELNDFAIHGPGFVFDFNSCRGPLAPGASCAVGYYFVPSEYGLYAVTASITAVPYVCPSQCGTVNPTITFDLIGTGTFPLSYLSPSALNFTATVGATSSAQTVVLRDYRALLDVIDGISITGPNANLYHQTSNCKLLLEIGESCSITITFTPTAPGSYPATLQVLSSDPTSPQTVSLNGFAARSRYTPLIDFGQGFAPDALTLNGPATVTGGTLQLTSGPSSAASSAFYPTPVPTKSFDTEVSFQLLDPTAEGITFTIQGDGPNAVGASGGGLGYQGLAKSIAVKFDLKNSAGEGVDSTGIYVNGAAPTVPSIPLAKYGIDLHSGRVFMLHLSYNGVTLTVSLTDTLTQAVWTARAAEDIPGIVGRDTAYFGFTAGSGTPALTPNSARSERAAISKADSQQSPATSNILTWLYVANGETKAAQTISFPSLSGQTYGAAPISLAATASSGLPVSYTVTGPAKLSGSTLAITGAGNITVTASQTGNASFAPALPVTQGFTVVKALLTVTARSLSRAAGASNPALTYTLSGFVDRDTASAVSGTAALTTTAVPASPAGKYPITFPTEGLTAANYSFNYVAGSLTVTSDSCQTINYSSGFSASGLSLNGGATINGSALELTDGGLFEARSAFFSTALPTTSYTTDFTFQITDPAADGMTFVIQSNGDTVVGQSGGGLGYAGIPHSVAIKADLHNNAGEGTDSTGTYIDGAYPSVPAIDLAPAGIDLHSGHIFAAHLAYANGLTSGTITDTVTGVSASMNFPGDITQVVGNNAWFGFTAGTGAHSATQKILTWSYSGGAGCAAK